MSKTKKIILGVFIVAILITGIGYTQTQNRVLEKERYEAESNQSIFNVKFSGEPVVSDPEKVKAAITDEHYATLNVDGLTSKGEYVTATYTLQNTSTELAAGLAIETFNNNEEYFLIESELAKTTLVAGEATTVTVTVTLIKTPIKESVSSTVGIGSIKNDS